MCHTIVYGVALRSCSYPVLRATGTLSEYIWNNQYLVCGTNVLMTNVRRAVGLWRVAATGFSQCIPQIYA